MSQHSKSPLRSQKGSQRNSRVQSPNSQDYHSQSGGSRSHRDSMMSQDQVMDEVVDSEDEEMIDEVNPFQEVTAEHVRKCSRNVIDDLNWCREQEGVPMLSQDQLLMLIAEQYANYVTLTDQNEVELNTILAQYNLEGVKAVVQKFTWEEDFQLTTDFILRSIVEVGNLTLESKGDKELAMTASLTCLGQHIIMNEQNIVVVQLFSAQKLVITSMLKVEDGSVVIAGQVFEDNKGLFAVSLYSAETKEPLLRVDPEFIEFDLKKKTFTVTLNVEEEILNKPPNFFVDFYIRKSPENIEYGQSSGEKIDDKFLSYKILENALTSPCYTFPVPEQEEHDAEDRMKRLQEQNLRTKYEQRQNEQREQDRAERSKMRKLMEEEVKAMKLRDDDYEGIIDGYKKQAERSKVSKQSLVQMSEQLAASLAQETLSQLQQMEEELEKGSEESEAKSESESEVQESEAESEDEDQMAQQQQAPEPQISNREIKQELETAIKEAQQQYQQYKEKNLKLQERIIKIREDKGEHGKTSQSDGTMNKHKYYNTLAHVHQIRLDLTKTQERYNKMADELQKKLNEKQQKCNELNMAFMELKREVAKKAANSRTDKPIDPRLIEGWQVREQEKTKQLAALRLEILKLRNAYNKNQKVYKQKEELADGLHLIDFEQLKIENQTLNEKIEERNETLHKYQKSNTQTVMCLTHTKEKLHFTRGKNEQLLVDLSRKKGLVNQLSIDLATIKQKCQKDRVKRDKLQRQTGVWNTQCLLDDFEERKVNINTLKENKEKLEQKYRMMQVKIQQYRQITAQNRSMISTNRQQNSRSNW